MQPEGARRDESYLRLLQGCRPHTGVSLGGHPDPGNPEPSCGEEGVGGDGVELDEMGHSPSHSRKRQHHFDLLNAELIWEGLRLVTGGNLMLRSYTQTHTQVHTFLPGQQPSLGLSDRGDSRCPSHTSQLYLKPHGGAGDATAN